MPDELEELAEKLKGSDFHLAGPDSICQPGRVRWLGFDAKVGKAGVASLTMGLPIGQYQQLSPDMIHPAKDAVAEVRAALSRLQQLCKDIAAGSEYDVNYGSARSDRV